MPSIQELFEQLWSFDPLAYCSNPQKEVGEFCNNPQTEEEKSISEQKYARKIRANRVGGRDDPPGGERRPDFKYTTFVSKNPDDLLSNKEELDDDIPSRENTYDSGASIRYARQPVLKGNPFFNPFTCCAAISVKKPNEIDDLTPQKEQQPTPSPQMIVRENSNDSDSSFAQLETVSYNGILFRPL